MLIINRLKEYEWWNRGTPEYYLTALLMVLMPIYHWYLTPVMIIWGLIWILRIRENMAAFGKIESKNKILSLLFLLLYFWQLAGLFYSDDLSDGLRNVSLRLPILLFPLVLISPGEAIQKRIKSLLSLFSLSTFIFIIICFGYALTRSIDIITWTFDPHPYEYPWLNFFYGPEFAIFQHPSYLSMFCLLSAFIAFEFSYKELSYKFPRWSGILIGVILLVSVYLLSSRASILASIVIVPVYLIYKFVSGSLRKAGLLGIIFICLILLVFFISNPRVQTLLKSESKKELIDNAMKESRISIWKAAFNIIKANPVIGVGTGDIQNELNEEYNKTGNKDLTNVADLNAHNQFIEITAENGIIGLLIISAIFCFMTVVSIREKNAIYLVFITISFFSFIFETMLNRLAGLAFFSFFSLFLLMSGKEAMRR